MLTPWQLLNSTDGMLVRVINGFKALCTQTYDEMNKKRGLQWAASRLITDAPTSTGAINSTGVYYSILRTGDNPVDLKSREFAHTGTTVIADIFENPVYTGGSGMRAVPIEVLMRSAVASPTSRFCWRRR